MIGQEPGASGPAVLPLGARSTAVFPKLASDAAHDITHATNSHAISTIIPATRLASVGLFNLKRLMTFSFPRR
jgi:hypothetical protein